MQGATPMTPNTVSKPIVSWLSRIANSAGVRNEQPGPDNEYLKIAKEASTISKSALRMCVLFNALEHEAKFCMPLLDFPNTPKSFMSVSRGETRAYLDNDSLYALSNFYDSCAVAVELSRGFFPTSGPIELSEELVRAAQAWRVTCLHAIEALQQVSVLLQNVGAKHVIPDAKETIALLLSAAEKGIPRLACSGPDDDGSIAEMRRHPRYSVSVPVTLELDYKSQPAILRDISRGGCGLETISRPPDRVAATISISNGIALKGKVVWSSGLRSGIQFDEVLSEAEVAFISGIR
jgi:PilZ domain